MSENDNRVPSALVAVGNKALAVQSETLVKRGLALAKSLQFPKALRESKPSKEQLEDSARFVDRVGQSRQLLGNTDGAIAEYREALRLNPDYALAHYNLGSALCDKGDLREALQEYRTAYELNPQNPDYQKAYERLLRKTLR